MESRSGQTGISLNQFEYAYAVEAFDPEAETIKVRVPKLMSNIEASPNTKKSNISRDVFANSSECKVSGAASATSQGYIVAKVVDKRNHTHPELHCYNTKYGTWNCPNICHQNNGHHSPNSFLVKCMHDHWHYHFNNEPVGGGYIPAGAKLIVMFMDGNINDCWVTRFICRY